MVQLKIDSLAHRYGRDVVFENLSLVTSSSPLGIAGSNGSGKSTLLKCLAGLLRPRSGTILWSLSGEAEPLEAPPEKLERSIGFAAPYVELYETLTVRENLEFLERLHGESRSAGEPAAGTKLDSLLADYQADAIADAPYGELSTGQRQRAKLAAASIHRPRILCLDEPGSNLDRSGRELIRQTAEQLTLQGGMVLIASNQPSELEICARTFDLDKLKAKPAV